MDYTDSRSPSVCVIVYENVIRIILQFLEKNTALWSEQGYF